MLASSLDWSISLWNPFHSDRLLASINYNDNYVFDVKWHPTLLGVFASCDGDGNVDIWSISNLEEPK